MKTMAASMAAALLAATLTLGLSGCTEAKKTEFREGGQEIGQFLEGGAQKMGEGFESAGDSVQPGVETFKSVPEDTKEMVN